MLIVFLLVCRSPHPPSLYIHLPSHFVSFTRPACEKPQPNIHCAYEIDISGMDSECHLEKPGVYMIEFFRLIEDWVLLIFVVPR